MSITPLAPRLPQIAAAAPSFKTVISSMSSGLIHNKEANSSWSAEAKSNESSILLSKGIPFSKISGCELELIEVIPRIRITVPLPKSPELATISKPAIRPCKASSIEGTDPPSIAFVLNFCIAPEYSRSGIANAPPPVTNFDALTCTSFSTFCVSNFTSNFRCAPMGRVLRL